MRPWRPVPSFDCRAPVYGKGKREPSPHVVQSFWAGADNMLDHMLADTPERLSSEDDAPTPSQHPTPGGGAPAKENGAHARDQTAR